MQFCTCEHFWICSRHSDLKSWWLPGTFLQNGDLHKLFLQNYCSYNAVTWHGTFYCTYMHIQICSSRSDPQSKMAATPIFVKQQRPVWHGSAKPVAPSYVHVACSDNIKTFWYSRNIRNTEHDVTIAFEICYVIVTVSQQTQLLLR